MAKRDYTKYKQIVRFLKKKYASAIVVKVRRVKRKTMDGGFIKHKKSFTIYINNDLDEGLAIETFIHEFAHVLSWSAKLDHACEQDENYDEMLHDSVWGIRYAELYRLIEKEFAVNIKNG